MFDRFDMLDRFDRFDRFDRLDRFDRFDRFGMLGRFDRVRQGSEGGVVGGGTLHFPSVRPPLFSGALYSFHHHTLTLSRNRCPARYARHRTLRCGLQ